MFRYMMIFMIVVPSSYGNMDQEKLLLSEITEFDSLYVRFVSNWPFGPSHAVLATDYHVLLASGGGVYVLNIDDPANPFVATDTIRTRGFVTSLRIMYLSPPAVVLYVGAGNAGIEVWDMLDVLRPERMCVYDTPGYTYDYDAMGTFKQTETYVAAGDSGLRIISLWPQPEELGYYYTPGSARGIRFNPNLCYVADGYSGLRIIDVSDPYNPYEIGSYDTDGYANAVDVYWNHPEYYAYIADGEDNVIILDINDPSNPQYAGQYYDPFTYTNNVEVKGNYLFLSNGFDGFEVITLGIPPQPVSSHNTPGYACDAAYSFIHDCALVADRSGGLRIIDINLMDQELGYYDVPGWAVGVFVAGTYAYIADGTGGLRVLDISTITYPTETGYCNTDGFAWKVYVSGSYAYVAANLDGLTVIDITSPINPQVVSTYNTAGHARDVYIVEPRAYVADGSNGLRIIDISEPSNPQEVGYCDTPDYACGVFVADSFVYIADGDSGLRIINISNPTNPYEVGFYDTPGYAQKVHIIDSIVYVADGSEGLRIINVSIPSNPVEIGYNDTPGNAYDVYVANPYAYIADGDSGLRVIDITTSSNPQEVGYYTTPDDAYGICALDSLIFVADTKCGLQIYSNMLIGVKETSSAPVKSSSFGAVIFSGPLLLPEGKNCKVFDITGREIQTINPAPGIYFIEVDGKITRKVVKVR